MRRTKLLILLIGSIVSLGMLSMMATARAADLRPVSFTFDDGPDTITQQLVGTLKTNGMTATFFEVGTKASTSTGQKIIKQEIAGGNSVQIHTWDHKSFTGESTNTAHLTEDEIKSELNQGADAIAAAGAPRPTLYRPPYGNIDPWSDNIAQHAGFRIVMSWSYSSKATVVDSKDWTDISAKQIAANVEAGILHSYEMGAENPVVAMHSTLKATVQAIPIIAKWMKANGFYSTTEIRGNATGGVVPPPAPPEPTSGNLVANPSLETMWPPNNFGGFPTDFPMCWEKGNWGINTPTYTLTPGHTGDVAVTMNVTDWQTGDVKIQIPKRSAGGQTSNWCTPVENAVPGATYQIWQYYKGDWPGYGAVGAPTKVSFALFYRTPNPDPTKADIWTYWTNGPLVTPSSEWNLASFTTPPLPAGATGVSFGLLIAGNGTLTVDDAAMIHS